MNNINLDDPSSWKSLDSLGVEQALRLFPDQLRESWEQVENAASLNVVQPPAVIICGMGGSSLAGRIIAGLFENELKIPIYIYNDYGLPGWVSQDTLVVVNSYSGNTEETLSNLASAQRLKANILGLATGGTLAEKIKQGEIGGVILSTTTNPTGFPKTGLGLSLGGLSALLSKTGIIPLEKSEFLNAVKELVTIREDWLPEKSKEQNSVKELAVLLGDAVPVLVSARPLLGALLGARNVINEIGRTFALLFDLPELDHHLVEAAQMPKSVVSKLQYLFFYTKFAHLRVQLRYRLTQELFNEQGLKSQQLDLKGSTPLVQALEIPHFCAWLAFYVAILNGQDPSPEPWINKLKERL